MKNSSFSFRIFAIFIIPSIALLYFTFNSIQTKYQNLNKSKHLIFSTKVIHTLSDLIHNIQIERGLSAGYIVANDTTLTPRLKNQYKKTDAAYNNFLYIINSDSDIKTQVKKRLEFKNINKLKNLIHQLSNIIEVRDKVLNSHISFKDEINYYTYINKNLIHIIGTFIALLNQKDQNSLSLIKLENLKENAGLERAYIYNQVLSKEKSNSSYEQIMKLQNLQELNQKEFFLYASIQSSLIYSQNINQKTLHLVEDLREKFNTNLLSEQNATNWFEVSTQRIDMFENITAIIIENHLLAAKKTYNDALQSLVISAFLSILASLSLLILAYLLIRFLKKEEHYTEELRIASYTFDSHEAMVITDVNGTILKVNNGFSRITGYTQEEAIGNNPNILRSDKHNDKFFQDMWHKLHTIGKWSDEIYNKRKNGEIYLERLSITAIKNENDITTHYIAQFLDISDLKEAQEIAEHQADHDFLTGLANRKHLMSRLQEEFVKARRHNFLHAFIFIDLDHFKKVNDNYGHGIGDKLIIMTGDILRSFTREEDFIARISGDEFAIMLLNIKKDEAEAARDVKKICQKLLNRLSEPILIDEHRINIGASIGIKLFPDGERGIHDVMVHADTAMYQAKKQGKNQYVFFDKVIESELKHLSLLESEIKNALKNNEFIFYYQPRVNTKTNKIHGAELLIRWEHPSKGILLPKEFLTVCINMGLLNDITDLALSSASKFIKNYGSLFDGTLSININATVFLHAEFEQKLNKLISQYEIDASKIELEITEDELVRDFDLAINTIKSLQKLGVICSIDDFGTGYSSITYLKQLPVDIVKIDRKFLQNFEIQANQKLIKLMISMAHTFNMDVTVEGIENQSQLDFMKENNALLYQGFHFSQAIEENQFINMIKEKN